MTRGKKIYLWALVIYCLLLAGAIGAGLNVLWDALESYEASRPEKSIEQYMLSHGQDYWVGEVQKIITNGFNEFSDPAATPEDFGIDSTAAVTWRRSGGTDTEEIYEIRIGTVKVCTLKATQTTDVGFGLRAWEITSEEFAFGTDKQITVVLPEGAVATLNGVPVGEAYRVGDGTLDTALNHDFDLQPASRIYTVTGLRGPIELKAQDAEGNDLDPVQIGDAEVHFYPEPEQSFGFHAPAAATVTINGTDISGTLCRDASPKLLPGALLWYEGDGLFAKPEIVVTMNGLEAEPTELDVGYCLIPGASMEIDGELEEFLIGFIHAYVDFTANKNGAAETNFRKLAPYLISGSNLYASMYETRENIVWARTSGLTYHSTECDNLIPLDENTWACSIRYSASYVFNGQPRDVESESVLLIIRENGTYKVKDMSPSL